MSNFLRKNGINSNEDDTLAILRRYDTNLDARLSL